jgi:hypothetical protein
MPFGIGNLPHFLKICLLAYIQPVFPHLEFYLFHVVGMTPFDVSPYLLQGAIWKDACKRGFDETPLRVINFVNSVKVTQ